MTVGDKLGGNNLSDSCYVELMLRGLDNKEKGELIKAHQVLRQSKDPYYQEGVCVLVTDSGNTYRACITRSFQENGQTYVAVKFDGCEGFDTDTEDKVEVDRLTLDVNVNTHVKTMEVVRASTWVTMCDRIHNDVGPQPYYTPRSKHDKRKLYTYQ